MFCLLSNGVDTPFVEAKNNVKVQKREFKYWVEVNKSLLSKLALVFFIMAQSYDKMCKKGHLSCHLINSCITIFDFKQLEFIIAITT